MTLWIKSAFTLAKLVSLCRFIKVQTLQDVSVKRVYSAADPLLFILLIIASQHRLDEYLQISRKKTFRSAKLCRDFAKGLLLEFVGNMM